MSEGYTHSRVEHAPGDPVKGPHHGRQRPTKGGGHEEHRRGGGLPTLLEFEDGLRGGEGHEEEHEGAAELGQGGDDLVADGRGHAEGAGALDWVVDLGHDGGVVYLLCRLVKLELSVRGESPWGFGEGGAEGVQHPAYMPFLFGARKPRAPLGIAHILLHPLVLPPKLDRRCGARKSQTNPTAQHDLMLNMISCPTHHLPASTTNLSSSPFDHGSNLSHESGSFIPDGAVMQP